MALTAVHLIGLFVLVPAQTKADATPFSVRGSLFHPVFTFRSPLTPDELPEGPPQIPAPDYDSNDSKTLERKKKKSVSFVEDISRKEEASVKKINSSAKKQPESILKEPSPPTHCLHGKPILRAQQPPQPVLAGDKYMQPIERIPR